MDLLIASHALSESSSALVQEMYANASALIKNSFTLNKLLSVNDKLDWSGARQEELGDHYDGC
jgi:hypothetical protein